jgi:hypothetical protein
VRCPGVELGCLAGLENEVVLAENQPESAVEDEDPVVALVGAEVRLRLDALGIPVVEGRISRLETEGGHVTGVRLDDDRLVAMDAVVVSPQMRTRAEPFARIGIQLKPHPAGTFIETDRAAGP